MECLPSRPREKDCQVPIIIPQEQSDAVVDSIKVSDLVSFLADSKIDTRCEDSMLATSDMLKKLSNNRSCVAEIALEDLKSRGDLDHTYASYGPQTIMLHYDRRQNFYIRANFWPAAEDHIFRSSGADAFFYYSPHDHNFNFMTVGYFGPGYESNYYEYNYEGVHGYPGEDVDLKFIERSSLSTGKVMLYRAFRDVHDQRPAKEMSMSINIMESTLRGAFMDQYEFDIENSKIKGMINKISASSLLPVIAQAKEGNSEDFLHETVRSHFSGRVRCLALSSLASVAETSEGSRRIYESGLNSDLAEVRGFSRSRLDLIERVVGLSA